MSTADDEISALLDELCTLTADTQKLVRYVARDLDLVAIELQQTISDTCAVGGCSVTSTQVIAAITALPHFRSYIERMTDIYQHFVFRALMWQIHRRLGEIETSLRLLASAEI